MVYITSVVNMQTAVVPLLGGASRNHSLLSPGDIAMSCPPRVRRSSPLRCRLG